MIWDVEQKEVDQSKLKVKFCGTKFSNKNGIGQNGQISFRKTGKEDCGYMVCGSKIFFVPSEKYEPNIQPTL